MSEDIKQTLRDRITEDLAGRILSGELRAGDRLPSERELADSLGVSRSIVHLAIEDLGRAGMVEMRPRSGNYVADYRRTGTLQTIEFISRFSSSRYDEGLVRALVDFRNAIEGAAMIGVAELCAAGGLHEETGKLSAMVDELENAAASGAGAGELAVLEKDFHYEIVRASDNFMFPMIMNSFEETAMPIWVKCLEFWGAERTVRFNREIISLLEQGRGVEAAQIISDMFSEYKEAHSDE